MNSQLYKINHHCWCLFELLHLWLWIWMIDCCVIHFNYWSLDGLSLSFANKLTSKLVSIDIPSLRCRVYIASVCFTGSHDRGHSSLIFDDMRSQIWSYQSATATAASKITITIYHKQAYLRLTINSIHYSFWRAASMTNS